MTSMFKKHGVEIISATAILIICVVWWANGAELEDAWLYAFSIFIVLMPALDAYFKNKKNAGQ